MRKLISISENKEALWVSYLRYKLVPSQFPREIFHSRAIVRSELEYVNALRMKWKTNCFTSVYTLWQKRNNVVDTIYLESDHSSLSIANEELSKMISYFKNEGIFARIFFSGRRSYHYYIDFPPIKLINPSEAIRNFTKDFPIRMSIDPTIWGNLSALARIPGTIHEGTGMYCIPVSSTPDPSECISLENVNIPAIVPNKGVADALLGIKTKPKKDFGIKIVKESGGSIPPCILSLMKFMVNSGNLSHPERLHLGTYLLRTVGKKETLTFFKDNAIDFKNDFTVYQLDWLEKKSWHCYNCERSKEIGICPLDPVSKCYFYPSINLFFG